MYIITHECIRLYGLKFLENTIYVQYAQGDYVYGAKLCKGDVRGALNEAPIKCGFADLASFSKREIVKVTGNPMDDGCFKIGDSMTVGILPEIR